MRTPVRGFAALRTYLEMIKIEHSIFALPFAMIGMMWGSMSISTSPWPGWEKFGLIVLAMVTCRSAAMAFNRIIDRNIDANNPRTAIRALPAGLLQLRHANIFFYASCAIFIFSTYLLNPLAFALSPIALGVTLFYSLTKRFTHLCHFILGLSLAIAPAAAWIAVTRELHPAILPVVGAVMFWTAGFDIIYSLQDEEFDKENGLRSIPAAVGKKNALIISRTSHAIAILLLAFAGWQIGSQVFWFIGVGVSAAILYYEQSIVKPDDLSRVNLAFFTLNGFVSLGLFVFALVDALFRAGTPT